MLQEVLCRWLKTIVLFCEYCLYFATSLIYFCLLTFAFTEQEDI